MKSSSVIEVDVSSEFVFSNSSIGFGKFTVIGEGSFKGYLFCSPFNGFYAKESACKTSSILDNTVNARLSIILE